MKELQQLGRARRLLEQHPVEGRVIAVVVDDRADEQPELALEGFRERAVGQVPLDGGAPGAGVCGGEPNCRVRCFALYLQRVHRDTYVAYAAAVGRFLPRIGRLHPQ